MRDAQNLPGLVQYGLYLLFGLLLLCAIEGWSEYRRRVRRETRAAIWRRERDRRDEAHRLRFENEWAPRPYYPAHGPLQSLHLDPVKSEDIPLGRAPRPSKN